MNSYIPRNVKLIREKQKNLEESIRKVLHQMAEMIRMENGACYTEIHFKMLENELEKMAIWAYEERNNTLRSDNQYFIKYVEMRKNQSFVLKKLYKNMHLLHSVPKQAIEIAQYIEEVSRTFHEYNNVEVLERQLNGILEKMKQEPMPVTREEFENRAVLYRILYDLEEFLQIKIQFIVSLTKEEIEHFWNDEADS